MSIISPHPLYNSGQRPFGLDRFFAPIRVQKDVNDLVRIDIGAGYVDRILAPGDYYMMIGNVSLSEPTVVLRSLLGSIASLSGVGALTWAYTTPLLSAQSLTGGVTLVSSANDVQIDLSAMHASWRDVFGAVSGDLVISQGWRSSRTIGAQVVLGPAASKFADYSHEQYSSGGVRSRYTYRWGDTMTRELIYRDVPASNVRRTRASEDPAWASQGAMAQVDTRGTWQDVWEPLSRGSLGVILHNYGFQRLNPSGESDPTLNTYEIVRLADESQQNFRTTLPDVNLRGERYTISATFEVLFSQYSHS